MWQYSECCTVVHSVRVCEYVCSNNVAFSNLSLRLMLLLLYRYDFTIRKPDKPWTRDELHEQMLKVQQEIHARAIAGDFSPENLEKMRQELAEHDAAQPKSIKEMTLQQKWDMVHPGLEPGEQVNEGD
jgi:hypothetical protein